MESKFDGGLLGLIGTYLLVFVLTFFTLGIGLPWGIVIFERWIANHTTIDGKRLEFDGTGLSLLGNGLLWLLLSIITLGIYGLWVPIKYKQWAVSHTHHM